MSGRDERRGDAAIGGALLPGTVMPSADHWPELMRRALALAERGRGAVHPNPLVGAVLVKDGRVIGEGWHTAFGKPHAEVEALAAARGAGADCRGATLVVTLEPCCHHGKTPPCTEAIIAAGVTRVIHAMDDPNPLVAGRGRAALAAAGIEVIAGIEPEPARELNEAYIHHQRTGLPFVAWKVALTLDGQATLVPGRETRITGPEAREYVDQLRGRADAVMIGVETILIDDPTLRVRNRSARDPLRIVMDTRLRTPETARIVVDNRDGRTLIVTSAPGQSERGRRLRGLGVGLLSVPERAGRIDAAAALAKLAEMGIIEILVESGGRLGRSLLAEGLLKRLIILQAPIWTTTAPAAAVVDIPVERLRGRFSRVDRLGDDARLVVEL